MVVSFSFKTSVKSGMTTYAATSPSNPLKAVKLVNDFKSHFKTLLKNRYEFEYDPYNNKVSFKGLKSTKGLCWSN